MKYLIICLYDSEGTHVSSYLVQHHGVVFQNQGELEKWLDENIRLMAKDEDWEDLNGVYWDDVHIPEIIERDNDDEESKIVKDIRKTKSVLKHYHPVFGKDFDITLDFRDREPAFRILGYPKGE